jgi:hypothetical protein
VSSPKAVFRLGPTSFGSKFACKGDQIASVARFLERHLGPLEWWVADISLVYGESPGNIGVEDTPSRYGTTVPFAEWALQVNQFLSGVFIATRADTAQSAVRTSASWLDDPWSDIAEAVAEVRAFDTSFVEVSLADDTATNAFVEEFRATPISR